MKRVGKIRFELPKARPKSLILLGLLASVTGFLYRRSICSSPSNSFRVVETDLSQRSISSDSNAIALRNAPLSTEMYIELLKRGVLNFLYQCHPPELNCVSTLSKPGEGFVEAKSMIGMNGLNMVDKALRTVLLEQIPGDVIETGVYKGGTSIFMAGMLKAMGDTARHVYVADSFAGIPPVDIESFPVDEIHKGAEKLIRQDITSAVVSESFYQFDLLDSRVVFVEGWFKDTLHTLQVASKKLALLRMDGDLFASSWDALLHLFPLVSMDGFIIVDDYGDWVGCELAVDWYREFCGESAPIERFDSVHDYQKGKFAQWRKSVECPHSKDTLNQMRKAREEEYLMSQKN